VHGNNIYDKLSAIFSKEMLNLTKIAYVQMEVVSGQPALNAAKILSFLEQAKQQKVELVVFPEMVLSGKLVGDAVKEKSFLRDCKNFGKQIAEVSGDMIVIFGNVDSQGQSKYFIAHENKIATTGKVEDVIPMNCQGDDGKEYFIAFKIAAEHFKVAGQVERDEIFSAKARELKSSLIYVNAVGIQNTGKTVYVFDGASTIYNSKGEVIQRAVSYKEGLHILELETLDAQPAIQNPKAEEVAEIYQALHFGVERFLKQIGMKKVVIGVSGGIDSAVASALYTKILGAENVYLVNMPSVFNSVTTRGLSEQLAKNLGCKYLIVPIQESVDYTVRQLEGEGVKISSFVKENIQARDRSSRILAAVAAAIGGGFTCNANKAESTVGYATLYGDAAGFLSALADLWKFQVYALANYLNKKIYKRETIPQGIIDIVPSAELSTAQNVDEGKGDPLKYQYHDYLFRALVEKSLTPEDILQLYAEGNLEVEIGCEVGLVEKYFPTAKDFIEDLERWWRLFKGMAVAKRIQAPPIISISSRAYGSFAESQNIPYFTQEYKVLKKKILTEKA